MRRKISLYIAGQPVDLDEQSFILFNYTMEEMRNPTIVRNSFSQSITLKGTPNNNKVFGNIYRSDRQTKYADSFAGVHFDPARKTPFIIYNEMNEILEEGYMKLDKVSRMGKDVEYNVTLFGGLGSFFYGLTYDEQGNKRTLADLLYTGQYADDSELDFRINKDAVMNAWKRLNGDTSKSALWDVINFAPAYNGLPAGTFDADKCIINTMQTNVPVPDGYSSVNGYVLATLPKKYTEWDVHDLRSYLQKPVIKMSKIIDAICQPYNNGGYEVVLDDAFFNSSNSHYSKTWLTLPIINSLKVEIREDSGYVSPYTDGRNIYIPNGGDVAGVYEIDLLFSPRTGVELDEGTSGEYLYMNSIVTTEDAEGGTSSIDYKNYLKYTLSAYDANGYLIDQQVKCVSSAIFSTPDGMIDCVGYFTTDGLWRGDDVRFSIELNGVSHISIDTEIVGLAADAEEQPMRLWYSQTGDGKGAISYGYTSDYASAYNTYKYISSEAARSGATITKKALLSSDKTPADYLLSFCKMFGLVFIREKGIKRIRIMKKDSFYGNDVIDISKRVNLSESISMTPYLFDSRWYDMVAPSAKGEYIAYYENVYGRKYGLQRINTGYEFNSDAKDLMKDILFRGAAEVMENSKFFVDLGTNIPAVFQDAGGTYVLLKDGEKEEFALPSVPSSASRKWWNSDNNTYDIFSKLQFHEAENKQYDERDTLVFFRGTRSLEGVTDRLCLTDDTAIMMSLNGNTPCWLLEHQFTDPAHKVTHLPMFSRYIWSNYGVGIIAESLDFGTPEEVLIPDVTFNVKSSIYSQYWEKYIKDRYDDDSKVMTCKVNLSGMQVNEDLFRKFYYWDGAIWALNKIINHSLTTWDDTECEFIKVQDINNYIG